MHLENIVNGFIRRELFQSENHKVIYIQSFIYSHNFNFSHFVWKSPKQDFIEAQIYERMQDLSSQWAQQPSGSLVLRAFQTAGHFLKPCHFNLGDRKGFELGRWPRTRLSIWQNTIVALWRAETFHLSNYQTRTNKIHTSDETKLDCQVLCQEETTHHSSPGLYNCYIKA